MSDHVHDPYCPVVTYQDEPCVCIRLESARADQNERIARAIEAQRTDTAPDTAYLAGWMQGMTDAAEITRDGGKR